MQYLGSHHIENNDTGIIDQFVIKGLQSALERGNVL